MKAIPESSIDKDFYHLHEDVLAVQRLSKSCCPFHGGFLLKDGTCSDPTCGRRYSKTDVMDAKSSVQKILSVFAAL